jgi:cell filamentation protein
VLSTLMALQAGLPPLDFGCMEGRGKRRYIAAIHAALGRDYAPMEDIFRVLIARTRSAAP